jgi:hypothetical protein
MQAAAREHQYVKAGAALAAASVVAVAPVAPVTSLPSPMPAVEQAVRLVADGDSIFNIPLNFFDDNVNVLYNEVQAVDFAARSLFFSGPWFAVSPTNLWGVDPGDPSHFQSVINFLMPFPALSGMWGEDDPTAEIDFDGSGAGVGQQLWGLAAAELPVSDWCDAAACVPAVPTSPITGVTLPDFLLWMAGAETGLERFPLFDNWLTGLFQGTLQALSPEGFTFDNSYPGYVDPSGPAYPGFGFPGTSDVAGPDGTEYENVMPWSNLTYHLDPLKPWENFFNSLMAPPSTDGIPGADGLAIPGTGIELPTLEGIGRAFQALLAAFVMAFDPFTPGSPFCPGECTFITDNNLDYPDLVKDIGNLWPGNPLIDEWETAYNNGTANVPDEATIENAINILQQGFWDFQNPSPPPDWGTLFNPSDLAPLFHELWTTLGYNPPDLSDVIATPDAASAGTDMDMLGDPTGLVGL